MDQLLKRKRVYKSKVSRILAQSEGQIDFSAIVIKLQLEKVKELEKEGNALFEEIGLECKEEEYGKYEIEWTEVEEKLYELKVKIIERGEEIERHDTIRIEARTGTLENDLRLPKIELPIFTGQYDQWIGFRDLFETAIHNNVKLSGAQKLQYLKSALKGEANRIIQSIPISNDNYNEAWSLVNKRYQNIREIITAHLDRLTNQCGVQANAPETLRQLVDTSNECVRAIKVLGVPIQHWDVILVYHVVKLLDPASRQEWELEIKCEDFPTFERLMDFLELRAHAVVAGTMKIKGRMTLRPSKGPSVHHGSVQKACYFCGKDHSIYKCKDFGKLTVQEKRTQVKEKALCFNCLRKGHQASKCKASKCQTCAKAHNTMLHVEVNQDSLMVTTQESEPITSNTVSSYLCGTPKSKYVLLATAILRVQGADGLWQEARAMLDSASQSSFVTQQCCKRLRLVPKKTQVTIASLGGQDRMVPKGSVMMRCSARGASMEKFTIQALILSQISTLQPTQRVEKGTWSHLRTLELADPDYYKPGTIDILLGADIYGDLLEGGICKGDSEAPTAIQTILGWVLIGNIGTGKPSLDMCTYHSAGLQEMCMSQLWELPEEVPRTFLSTEERECENHYALTHSRTSEGRFMVRLPFKSERSPLGDSRVMAVKRFHWLETRLQKQPQVYEQYKDFMREYFKLGHMEMVPEVKVQEKQSYYLPHHAVVNPFSTSTKLRVVFDASAKTTTGTSLNDILLVGPKLQPDIVELLIKFRQHPVALTADIKKMYRQVLMHDNDRDFLRIVWRDSPEEPLLDYRLRTVTYGTASAPYQATKCLQQLARDERTEWLKESEIVESQFYVDDLLTGAESENEAIQLRENLQVLLAKGGFDLCKWASNSRRVQGTIPKKKLESLEACELGETFSIKMLGVKWNTISDTLGFNWEIQEIPKILTKRKLLAMTSRTYDPLGLISPVTVQAKLLLQTVWKLMVDWDEPLPTLIDNQWMKYQDDLRECQTMTITRVLTVSKPSSHEIHAFCDASEAAYAAVVYLKAISIEEVKVSLVMAKTRVAPLKTQTLPRLELCGALLLAKTVRIVKQALQVNINDIYAYTDSTVVLGWLRSSPARWKQFIANRVNEIQEIVPIQCWRHVRSKQNPADCASRGISAQALAKHELWWTGPQIVWQHNKDNVVRIEPEEEEAMLKEEKQKIIGMHTIKNHEILERYSSVSQLTRITAWMLRFRFNSCKNKSGHRQGLLKCSELQDSLYRWIQIVQHDYFYPEWRCLITKKEIPANSKIKQLNPFLDAYDLIRVGGRLRQANIPERIKHPILLPEHSYLTVLIVREEHVKLLHAGPQLTQAGLQQRYWIPRCRNVVRKMVHKCVTCQKLKPQMTNQMMGDLPQARIVPSRPFTHSGVDCAGPFSIKGYHKRGSSGKAYICLFVCFAVKAVHIEVLTGLSTAAFIACLRRFIARRGCPSHIYSDCGTNFVGTDIILRKWVKDNMKKNNEQLDEFSTTKGITWHFNPPSAPHFGGLWEAGIKSFKKHFVRIVGRTVVSLEELQTISAQIEACLNSRPLIALPTEPQEISILTPAHFLVGESLMTIPSPVGLLTPENRLSRWELCQRLVIHFWKRWQREYLTQLQCRPKWKRLKKNVQIGEVVIIKEDNVKPLYWRLGRIIKVHPGQDGIVRTVTVKTKKGELIRPIIKIVQLDVTDPETRQDQ